MKKKNLFSQSLKWVLGVSAAAALFVGCKNYDDDINNLQKQIDGLETQINNGRSIADVKPLPGTPGGWEIIFTGTASPQSVEVKNGEAGTNATQWRIGAAPTFYWEYQTNGTGAWIATTNPSKGADGSNGTNVTNAISVGANGHFYAGTTDTGVNATPSTCVEYPSYFMLTIAEWNGTAWVKKDFMLPKYGDGIQSIEFIPSFVTFTGDPIIACAGINYQPITGDATVIGQPSVSMKFRLNPTGLDQSKFAFSAFTENEVNVTRALAPIFTLQGTPVYTKADGLYVVNATVTRAPRTIPTTMFTGSYIADQVALRMKNIKTDKDNNDISTFVDSRLINMSYKKFNVKEDLIDDNTNDITILKNSNYSAMNATVTAVGSRVVNIEYNLDLETAGQNRTFNLNDSVNTYAIDGTIVNLLSNYFANVIEFKKATVQPSVDALPAANGTVTTAGAVSISVTGAATLNSVLNNLIDIQATGYLKDATGAKTTMVADVIIRVKLVDRPVAKDYNIGNQNFTLTGAISGDNVYWDNNTDTPTTDDPTITKMIADLNLTAKIPGITAANFTTYYTMTSSTPTNPKFWDPVTITTGFAAWVAPTVTGSLEGTKYDITATYTPVPAYNYLPQINLTASLTCFLPPYEAMKKFRPMWLPTYTTDPAPAPVALFIKGIGTALWSMEGPMIAGFESYTLPAAYSGSGLTWTLCDESGADKTTEYLAEGVTMTGGKIKLDYTIPAALEYINQSKAVWVKAEAQLGVAGQKVAIEPPFQVMFGMPVQPLVKSAATMEIKEVNNGSASCYMLNAVSLLTAYEQGTPQVELITKTMSGTPSVIQIGTQVTLNGIAATKYGINIFQASGNTMTIETAPGTSMPATGTFTLETDPTSANFGMATWKNTGTTLVNDATVSIIITIKNTWNDGAHGSDATKAAVKYIATLKIKKA